MRYEEGEIVLETDPDQSDSKRDGKNNNNKNIFFSPQQAVNRLLSANILKSVFHASHVSSSDQGGDQGGGGGGQGLRLLDLYCGIGARSFIFAAALAGLETVGVDNNDSCIACCLKNAQTNGLQDRCKFVCSAVESYLQEIEPHSFDAVEVDPFGSSLKLAKTIIQKRGLKDGGLLFLSNTDNRVLASLSSSLWPSSCAEKKWASTDVSLRLALSDLASNARSIAQLSPIATWAFSHGYRYVIQIRYVDEKSSSTTIAPVIKSIFGKFLETEPSYESKWTVSVVDNIYELNPTKECDLSTGAPIIQYGKLWNYSILTNLLEELGMDDHENRSISCGLCSISANKIYRDLNRKYSKDRRQNQMIHVLRRVLNSAMAETSFFEDNKDQKVIIRNYHQNDPFDKIKSFIDKNIYICASLKTTSPSILQKLSGKKRMRSVDSASDPAENELAQNNFDTEGNIDICFDFLSTYLPKDDALDVASYIAVYIVNASCPGCSNCKGPNGYFEIHLDKLKTRGLQLLLLELPESNIVGNGLVSEICQVLENSGRRNYYSDPLMIIFQCSVCLNIENHSEALAFGGFQHVSLVGINDNCSIVIMETLKPDQGAVIPSPISEHLKQRKDNEKCSLSMFGLHITTLHININNVPFNNKGKMGLLSVYGLNKLLLLYNSSLMYCVLLGNSSGSRSSYLNIIDVDDSAICVFEKSQISCHMGPRKDFDFLEEFFPLTFPRNEQKFTLGSRGRSNYGYLNRRNISDEESGVKDTKFIREDHYRIAFDRFFNDHQSSELMKRPSVLHKNFNVIAIFVGPKSRLHSTNSQFLGFLSTAVSARAGAELNFCGVYISAYCGSGIVCRDGCDIGLHNSKIENCMTNGLESFGVFSLVSAQNCDFSYNCKSGCLLVGGLAIFSNCKFSGNSYSHVSGFDNVSMDIYCSHFLTDNNGYPERDIVTVRCSEPLELAGVTTSRDQIKIVSKD